MEFLVGFDLTIPDGTPESEVKERVGAEASAAAGLARQGHRVRLWTPPVGPGEGKAVGLYRAGSEAELDGLLGALPLNGWMQITVTPVEPHPNDPTSPRPSSFQLPDPRLTPIYRLEARQRPWPSPPTRDLGAPNGDSQQQHTTCSSSTPTEQPPQAPETAPGRATRPSSHRRDGPRQGWNGGYYAFMRRVLA